MVGRWIGLHFFLDFWVIPYEINQEKAKMFLTPSDFDKIWHTYWDYCEFKICKILDL